MPKRDPFPPRVASEATPASAQPGSAAGQGKHWFVDTYVQLWLSILLSAAAQVLLKKGADHAVESVLFGLSGLRSPWVWLGIAAMIASLVSWLHALRTVPLIVAYNLAGFIHVLVPLSSWAFLNEQIPAGRWCGIALVFAGVVVIARPAARAESAL